MPRWWEIHRDPGRTGSSHFCGLQTSCPLPGGIICDILRLKLDKKNLLHRLWRGVKRNASEGFAFVLLLQILLCLLLALCIHRLWTSLNASCTAQCFPTTQFSKNCQGCELHIHLFLFPVYQQLRLCLLQSLSVGWITSKVPCWPDEMSFLTPPGLCWVAAWEWYCPQGHRRWLEHSSHTMWHLLQQLLWAGVVSAPAFLQTLPARPLPAVATLTKKHSQPFPKSVSALVFQNFLPSCCLNM